MKPCARCGQQHATPQELAACLLEHGGWPPIPEPLPPPPLVNTADPLYGATSIGLIYRLLQIVEFHPPPGPPDPPPSHATVKTCPQGHELRWVSNRVAICLGDCLTPAYILERRYAPRVQLTREVGTAVIPLAHALRRVFKFALQAGASAQP